MSSEDAKPTMTFDAEGTGTLTLPFDHQVALRGIISRTLDMRACNNELREQLRQIIAVWNDAADAQSVRALMAEPNEVTIVPFGELGNASRN